MDTAHTSPPPIAALYLVVFDPKIGYKLAWSRTASSSNLSLDGVEYKSLPSGLHSVSTDLVYFRHNQHAGISAFQRGEGDAASRGAEFVSVGALVEIGSGRLGRAWGHARGLRELAGGIVGAGDREEEVLERYWEKWGGSARSEAEVVGEREGLEGSLDHPALDMRALLETFGPLVFPVYRAALCRKRMLLLGSAPVQQSCNFVYDISVLSSIPRSAVETLDSSLERLFRAQPLFSVGIHDIPELQSAARSQDLQPMLACTTDDILGEKKDLYNVLVELPSATADGTKRWPRIRTSDGGVLKATRRDLRRYRALTRELRRMRAGRRQNSMRYRDDASESNEAENEDDDDDRPLLQHRRHSMSWYPEDGGTEEDERETVEPASWTTTAYQTFMWWASAGEQDSLEAEDEATDQEMLANLPNAEDARSKSPYAKSHAQNNSDAESEEAQYKATALTAYFHRLSFLVISTLSTIVEEADDQAEEGIEEGSILIRGDEIRRLGLDISSENDKGFIKDIVQLYFGRKAVVEASGVMVCGMRVC